MPVWFPTGGLDKPDLIISVTGAATTLDLKPEMQQQLSRSLAAVVSTGKSWVITGGTDVGVMKLVAAAVHNRAKTIGFTVHGKVEGALIFNGQRGGKVEYANDQSDAGLGRVRINDHHTHFIFVDGDNWGDEIDLRYRFESFYRETRRVPIVQLVVGGGEGTVDNVHHAILAGYTVIVINDCPGPAKDFCELARDEDRRLRFPFKRSGTDVECSKEKADGLLRSTFEAQLDQIMRESEDITRPRSTTSLPELTSQTHFPTQMPLFKILTKKPKEEGQKSYKDKLFETYKAHLEAEGCGGPMLVSRPSHYFSGSLVYLPLTITTQSRKHTRAHVSRLAGSSLQALAWRS